MQASPVDSKIRPTEAKLSVLPLNGKRLKAVFALVVVFIWALSVYHIVSHLPKPDLQANERYHDFGQVSRENVTYVFSLGNEGNADLTILNIWTSCGCTSARLTVAGVESPEFSKKGDAVYDKGWHACIHPGERAQLHVRYNPWVTSTYYSGERTIFIESDDPTEKVFMMTIKVHEIP